MTVRMLEPGDEALLATVVARFKETGGPSDPAAFLHDGSSVVWVAEDGGDVIGWCWGSVLARPDGRTDLLLYELEVMPSHRRRGFGNALVEAVLGMAEARAMGKVWLLADPDNTAALGLYGEAGGVDAPQIMFSWVVDGGHSP